MAKKRQADTWVPELSGKNKRDRQEQESAFFDAHVTMMSHPRRLLSRLRDIMAGAGHAEDKLNQIVKLVALTFHADACSVYVLRSEQELELFATLGLKQEAVHNTKLNLGEGLVGNIALHACPLSLADAQSNPNFAYKEETGEEIYASFCGVPILRGQRVRGVIVVQNKKKRHYGEELIEMLQTVAMLLAELIASGGLIARHELAGGGQNETSRKPSQIHGKSFSTGIAIGTVVLYEPKLNIREIVAENPKEEIKRLRKAVVKMHSAIDIMIKRSKKTSDQDTNDILETYQLFSKDKSWLKRIENTIGTGLVAEAAVQRVLNEMQSRLSNLKDAYIKERLSDIEDLSNRLLCHLMNIGSGDKQSLKKMPKNFILVAKNLGPAALLDYDPKKLKGVIMVGGSASNHASIVARALGIPIVGQCGDEASSILDGETVIVDALRGLVHINPEEHVLNLHRKSENSNKLKRATTKRLKHQPAQTLDGVSVSLNMNAGLVAELPLLEKCGADGVGLYRTELSFMGWAKYPRVSLQAELYGQILDEAGGRPVTFRTLDIGGDKPLPYFKAPVEENPALGWRAIRIAMDRPAILRTQIRALIMGANGRPLRVMLPLVSELAELDRAREFIDMELDRAKKRGLTLPEKFEIGVMIEVPSLLWQLDQLLSDIDFVAIGTNDLMQYLYAVDYRSDTTRNRYDTLSPAMLKALQTIAKKCKASNVSACICGEMASSPLDAIVLVALGFESLSMQAQAVGGVKEALNSLNANVLRHYLNDLMSSRDHSLRDKIFDFARDHDVVLTGVKAS